MRKMATVRRVDAVNPIPDADAIEVATLGGWRVVIKKGDFVPGDLAVYCEIDSWIPHELAPFLSKGKEPRVYEGVLGERLRTVKLRGQVSQGLLLPLEPTCANIVSELFEGLDVSFPLNIVKYEPPIPAQLAGLAKGPFPSVVPRTDQERVQNLVEELKNTANMAFEVTEKLEGSSMTVYRIQGEFGVCSRNLDLKETEGNSFWATARRDDIEAKMIAVDEFWDFAIQGELVGPGVQGNIYKLNKPEFYVFDVYNIQTGEYLKPDARRALIERMGLKHVPVFNSQKHLNDASVETILSWAEGKSVMGDIVGPEREGLVFKQVEGGMTFKAISNKYLLGEK